jgi:hypothetical protein
MYVCLVTYVVVYVLDAFSCDSGLCMRTYVFSVHTLTRTHTLMEEKTVDMKQLLPLFLSLDTETQIKVTDTTVLVMTVWVTRTCVIKMRISV